MCDYIYWKIRGRENQYCGVFHTVYTFRITQVKVFKVLSVCILLQAVQDFNNILEIEVKQRQKIISITKGRIRGEINAMNLYKAFILEVNKSTRNTVKLLDLRYDLTYSNI